MLGGCQPALKRSHGAGTQLGPDLLRWRVWPLTPLHAREAEKTQRPLSRSCLFSLHPALHAAPSPGSGGGEAGAPRLPGDWRDSPRVMHTGAASPHAGFPSSVPKPLMGSGLRGAARGRGALPGSLPATSSSRTSPADRALPRGPQAGAREPPSQEGWVQAGFSLPLLPPGSRSARSSPTEQAHSSVSYGVQRRMFFLFFPL